MNVSSTSTPASIHQASTARAADGDYKTKGIGHEVKDADGDYKSTSAAPGVKASVAAASSSNGVRGALIDLPKGGV